MKSILAFLILLFVGERARAVNPVWVAQDKKLIHQVNSLVKASPTTVERYFEKSIIESHNLGFGWKSRKTGIGGGYISIDATFYYRNDTLISYVIYPKLPNKPELKGRYTQWYSLSFSVTSTGITPFRHNGAALQKPLSTDSKLYTPKVATAATAAYMSPESGLAYGDYGGYGMTMLQNREAFTKIQEGLSAAQVLLIMHSVNPASRLTAIEYYLGHKKLFTDQARIEQWIETVFRELPEVESINGCIGGKYNARALVAKFTKAD